MESLPLDPEHAGFVERARAHMQKQREELSGRPPFPVYALATPELSPGALAEVYRENDAWAPVKIVYGSPVAADGPWVNVTTSLGESPDLAAVLVDERDRLFD
ncbi:hypothetical protein BMS3Abin02_00452 [bacterium BMS3Abin02]|nr:hypothetical protein BMS3Abin02_00452 [bacterium BMS3Abin02]